VGGQRALGAVVRPIAIRIGNLFGILFTQVIDLQSSMRAPLLSTTKLNPKSVPAGTDQRFWIDFQWPDGG
jgi:hypothetical protein